MVPTATKKDLSISVAGDKPTADLDELGSKFIFAIADDVWLQDLLELSVLLIVLRSSGKAKAAPNERKGNHFDFAWELVR